jgi:hypothetical protein
MTGQPRRSRSIVSAGIAILLAISAAGMIYTFHVRREMERAGIVAAAANNAAVARMAATQAAALANPPKPVAPQGARAAGGR